MTNKEKYVDQTVRKVINTVKHKTVMDVKHLIEEVFILVYNEGYEAGKGVNGDN